MAQSDETRDESQRSAEVGTRTRAGVVVVLAAELPAAMGFELDGTGIEIGRGTPAGLLEDDERVSRRHVRLTFGDAGFVIEDLGSRNGTFFAGKRLEAPVTTPAGGIVRIGRSLLWLVNDVSPFLVAPPVAASGPVVGGFLRRAYGEIALSSRAGDTVCLMGESGAGKELGARAFHDARHGAASGAPFVAVNCAAIPEGLAERLLFGAKKGAYSGAVSDAEGYAQAAHRGTLFLDEIAELDLLVQAKLLRVLESREVLPLGASRPHKVELSVCVASHKSLREEVSAGRFREDLYFRIGRPEVRIPALRDRLDEIPLFVSRELHGVKPGLIASIGFVESVTLRSWPGNVRELIQEVRRAGHRAVAENVTLLQPEHLAEEAGTALDASRPADPAQPSPPKVPAPEWTDEQIESALAENDGNVRGTARALGLHRNQLRRWMEKRNPTTGSSTIPPDDDD